MWVLHELMASMLFLLLLLLFSLSTVYLVSKVRAAHEAACIFLPLFPLFPYQSEKVVATPTRETEIEVQAAGRPLKQRNAAPPDHSHKNDALYPLLLSGFICKANLVPCSQRFLFGHLAVLTVSPAQEQWGVGGGFTGGERLHNVMEK